MAAVADDEVLLSAIRSAGVFIITVYVSADIGLVIPLTFCGGYLDGEDPDKLSEARNRFWKKDQGASHATIRDCLGMLKGHDPKAIYDNLPGWLSEPSEMGCGDGITMRIAYFTKDEQEESEDFGDA